MGAAVVLIHGFSLDTRMWDPQFDVLARHFRTIRYDMRGFGQSPAPDGIYTQADDLVALLDARDIQRAHIIGLSMGGSVALDFAILHPARVDRLVLLDAGAGGHRWSDAWDNTVKAVWAHGRRGDLATARRMWLEFDLFKPALANPASSARLQQIVTEYSGWHWLNRDPSNGMDPPALQRLDEVVAPTLSLIGEHDLPDFHAIAAKLEAGIADNRTEVIDGVGHMSNMEAPVQVNRAVLAFLGAPAEDVENV